MKLKIFNLNCWLLPPPFSTNNNARLSQIISLIKQIKPDIIALQEVWLNKYVYALQDKLKDYSFLKSKNRLYNKSGLVTGLLINKPSRIHFFPITKKHSLVERLAQKGFHVIKLSKNLLFINTHIYKPTNNNEKPIAESQFVQIQKLIKLKKCILSGDLNLNEEGFVKVNRIFDYRYRSDLTNSSRNPYRKVRFNKHDPYENIDCIIRTKKNKISASIKSIKSPVVSDHIVIIGEIKI